MIKGIHPVSPFVKYYQLFTISATILIACVIVQEIQIWMYM